MKGGGYHACVRIFVRLCQNGEIPEQFRWPATKAVSNEYFIIIMTCTDLFVLSVLYTPSEDTFNDIQKSGINLTLAGSGL